MTNKLLTKKQIGYSTNEDELQQLLLEGKLPYIPKSSENDIHRPANLKLMNVKTNKIIQTHEIELQQLMSYGNEISDAINIKGPNYPAFKDAAKKEKFVSMNNAIMTLGDLMQMLNDEYLYRKFHETEKSSI